MPIKLLCVAAALALAPLAGALAQERSDAELRALFESQLETFQRARDARLGATRGLVLAPAGPAAAPALEAVEVEQAPPADGLDLTAGAPAAPVEYFVLPEEQQVNMRVNFAFDSAAIAASEEPKLRQICTVIDEAEVARFRIIGHTDATGDAAYNQRLSVRRAEEVRRFFIDDCGIEASRLEAIGVGKQFPANAADPYAAENRRVEFQAMG